MTQAFYLQVPKDGIARLYFDLPNEPVNLFNEAVLDELQKLLDELASQPLKALLIFSKKKDSFIAGADVREFLKINSPELGLLASKKGQETFHKLSQLPFPTVAVIHGACMGGGTEMSLACTYRLATNHPKTRIGLPEVRLGILPGWGGTQRLPAVTGLSNALKIILSGKGYPAHQALKMGLVDALITPEWQEEQALDFIRNPQKRSAQIRFETLAPYRWLLFSIARRNVLKKTFGFYPAPLRAIEVLQKTYSLPVEKGLKIEAQALADLISTPEAQNLAKLFVWGDEIRKQVKSQIDRPENLPQIRKVTMVGADPNLAELAVELARANINITLLELEEDRLLAFMNNIDRHLKKLLKIKKLTAPQADQIRLRFFPLLNAQQMVHADVVLYNQALKINLKNPDALQLVNMEQGVAPKGDLEAATRVVFFHMASRGTVVEMESPLSAPSPMLQSFLLLLLKLKKLPFLSALKDESMLLPLFKTFLSEIYTIWKEGTPLTEVENALVRSGFQFTPFKMFAQCSLNHLLPEEAQSPRFCREAKQVKRHLSQIELSAFQRQIVRRLTCVLVNAAAEQLERGFPGNGRHIELFSVLVLGFPPFLGGILREADRIGLQTIVDELKRTSSVPPTKALLKMAERGESFYRRFFDEKS